MDTRFLVRALQVDEKDPASKLIAAFLKTGANEAVVVSGKTYRGVVYSRDVVHRRTEDPHQLHVHHFLTSVTPVTRLDTTALMNAMTINSHKSVPVCIDSRYYFLTNRGMLAMLKENSAFASRTAADVMKHPYAIRQDETMAAALTLSRNLGIERIPVVDGRGRVAGLLTVHSLLRAWSERRRPQRGETRGEGIHPLAVPVGPFAEKDVPIVSPDTSLSEVVSLMVDRGETVLVGKERLVGIITPKPLFRLIGQEVKGATVSVSGLRVIESFEQEQINQHIGAFLQRVSRGLPVECLAMHVEQQAKGAVKTRYTIHARLITGRGFFFAQADDWRLLNAFTRVLDILRKETEKKRVRLQKR